MSKTLSVKYYRDNKERLPKQLLKDIKIFVKKKKKKSNNTASALQRSLRR